MKHTLEWYKYESYKNEVEGNKTLHHGNGKKWKFYFLLTFFMDWKMWRGNMMMTIVNFQKKKNLLPPSFLNIFLFNALKAAAIIERRNL